jgi:hypothetical protein
MKSHRSKFIRRVIVILLLGAIANIAITWSLAFVTDFDAGQSVVYDRDTNGTVWRVYHWRVGGANRFTSIWQTNGQLIGDSDKLESAGPKWTRLHSRDADFAQQQLQYDKHIVDGFGWPTIALLSSFDLLHQYRGMSRYTANSGIEISEHLGPSPRALPTVPIWPGFAINTIFYAALLWVLLFAPGRVRRMIRRRRGLCPACAYPVGTSEVCTECGGPVRL